MSENAILEPGGASAPGPRDMASRIAEQSLARRGAEYTSEVRRLLDAALEVIRQHGMGSRPRVADIVAAAGLSNDAFYRHFPSKDALVAALLEDGTERLASYLDHQMGKEATPEGRVRRWVEGIMAQTRAEIAATTLAVLWNGGSVGAGQRHTASSPLAKLLVAPLSEMGTERPELVAALLAHAVVGHMSDYLWAGRAPTRAEVQAIVDFCLAPSRR